jgi:hypothetical protein
MRLRRDRADEVSVPYDRRFPPRGAVAHGGEPSYERDEQLGRIFHNMRLSMKASRDLIARRLATAVSTVENFEAGAVGAFPHWRETERIVRGYCELLRLDPAPILWRIRSQLQAPASGVRPTAASTPNPAAGLRRPPSHPPPHTGPARRRRRGRVLFALSAPIALAAVVVYLTHVASGPVYHGIGMLPDVLRKPVRAGLDQLMLLTATTRDGLRWVDVSDPRARKADKLEPASR